MTLEQQFKKETGLDAYILNDLRGHIAIDTYVEWLEEKCTIADVSVTLPHIDEINKVLKNQIEDLEYTEKLDGYEMVAYKRGFTYCLKWLGSKLTKGN